MRRHSQGLATRSVLLALVAATGCSDPAPPAGSPEKIALIVAISNYPEEATGQWHDLPGAVNDAVLVRDLLEERFGFPPDQIKLLRNRDATHENIVTTFREWLIERATERTEVVFWYAGHGSRVPDESGTQFEVDGMDSTLVAWDSRIDGRRGEYDISDDEIASLLKALTAKTGRVTMITDACNSAGLSRGGDDRLRVRALPIGVSPHDPALIEPFWPADVPWVEDTQSGASGERYVHVSACSEREQAFEIEVETSSGMATHGALSWFLCDALRRAHPGDSYLKVTRETEAWIRSVRPSQSVHCAGNVDRALFSERFASRPPGYFTLYTAEGRASVEVEAGSLHGLQRGSRMTVADASGADLGSIEIQSVGGARSIGTWKGAPPANVRKIAMYASETDRSRERPPLPLHIEDPDLAALLGAELGEAIRLTGSEVQAYRLSVRPAGTPGDQPARIELIDPDGVDLGKAEDPETGWLSRLRQRIDIERRYQAILALPNTPGNLPLLARFVRPDDADLSDGGLSVRGQRIRWPFETAFRAGVERTRGGLLGSAETNQFIAILPEVPVDDERQALARIDVTNPHDQRVYLSVLSLSEDRKPNVIHPFRKEDRDWWLPAGATVPIYVLLDADARYTPDRPMRDRYLIISTLVKADFSTTIEQASMRGTASDLPPVLEDAFCRDLSRGTRKVESGDSGDYGVTLIEMLVSRPR